MKKVIAFLLVGLLLGSGTTYAASNYYADLLGNQEDQIKNELMKFYEEQSKMRNKQVHNDLVIYVASQRQDLIDYFEPIIQDEINREAVNSQSEHAEAVDEKVKQLKEKIYKMLEEELEHSIPRG
ncbi:hypothetical protein CEY16_05365 [Halalkalibacillus sediminis]|uniref:Sporulation protein n=1 Tax=Halalkalibacillus sediminis TaxID=2018042 RepID=A0A2I0QXW9_9BACI|nr:hypothetical protein [Halalkalibacillus sediminis]PKR79177.1 hypothetical protein CEY16_05365 [Halalkalibacillus sediminis]